MAFVGPLVDLVGEIVMKEFDWVNVGCPFGGENHFLILVDSEWSGVVDWTVCTDDREPAVVFAPECCECPSAESAVVLTAVDDTRDDWACYSESCSALDSWLLHSVFVVREEWSGRLDDDMLPNTTKWLHDFVKDCRTFPVAVRFGECEDRCGSLLDAPGGG